LFIITIFYCSPEGSATSSISGANPATVLCTDQSSSIPTPKPPPGYGDDFNSSLAESLSNQQNTSVSSGVIGKWPLKPGVLVHSKQQLLKLQSSNNSQSDNNMAENGSSPMEKIVPNENDKFKSKKINNTCKIKSAAECIVLNNETQSARTARIRRMMIGSNNNLQKKPSPMSPPPAPPLRANKDNSTSNNIDEKYPSVTGRQTTK
jgi:hypothetical protein